MSWRDQIRPASFRGITFGVTADDAESGRRTVVHEFPQRDDVYVEDLGVATGRFTLQAFVQGGDYMQRRDALERALNEPGPGTLVHPWYGEFQVSQCAPYKVRHSAQDGGMAVFTLSFVRDAAPGAPSAAIAAPVAARAEATGVKDLAAMHFDASVLKNAAKSMRAATAVATGAMESIANVSDELCGLLSVPPVARLRPDIAVKAAGLSVAGAFSRLGDFFSGDAAKRARGWTAAAGIAMPAQSAAPSGSTRAAIRDNDLAVRDLARAVAVAEASSALADAVPFSRVEAAELRKAYVDALDAAMPGMPDDLFLACAGLRAKTLEALADAARAAPQVIRRTPVRILPSLALAYAFSGTTYDDADLVRRNGIVHPGFAPVMPLEVLLHG